MHLAMFVRDLHGRRGWVGGMGRSAPNGLALGTGSPDDLTGERSLTSEFAAHLDGLKSLSSLHPLEPNPARAEEQG